jgi:O-antigen/teichoic acid export membrane protein
MNLRRLLGLGSLASIAPVVEFASRFGRTIILSRLLSPTEFGIGVALTALLGIAELITDISLDKFIMSRPRDDDREVLASTHKLAIVRGLLIAASIFLASPWIAEIFGIPEQAWSFRILAAVPLLRAFSHLELKLVQREFRYAPEATASTVSHVAVFTAVYPAVRWFGDHRAMLFILFLECIVYVTASHLLAKTRFRIAMTDRRILREAITYGLPLTLNGLGIAMMGQADRVLISNWFGVETLAFYAVVLNLTILPITAIFRILGVLGMSVYAREQRDPLALDRFNLVLIWIFTIVAACYAIFIAASLETLAPLLFGRAYAVLPLIATIVSMMVWLRVSRGAPTIFMLSNGMTGRLMTANLISGVGLVLAALLLHVVPRLETVLLCIMVGDTASLTGFFWGIRVHLVGRFRAVFGYLATSFAAAVTASLSVSFSMADDLWWRAGVLAAAVLMTAAAALHGLRRYLMRGGARS